VKRIQESALIILLMTLIATIVGLYCLSGELSLYHFDVDQADCTLLISPSGVSVLFDCGDAGWNSSRELRDLVPQIESILGSRTLDYIVVSHLHVDHVGYVGYGGLWGLLQTYGFQAQNILIRDFTAYPGDLKTKGFGLWLEYFENNSATVALRISTLGDVVDLQDGVTMTVCSVDGNGAPSPNTPDSPCPVSGNELSLGILVSYGDFQEWIGGDLGGTCIQRWFGPNCVQYFDIETRAAALIGDVEVLRVNHHGSEYSSNTVFLENLDPEVSIISVGETKSYGHPAVSALHRLLATSDVYVTTLGNKNGPIVEGGIETTDYPNLFVGQGTIMVVTDGVTYSVNGVEYAASSAARVDGDSDGYFVEVDPDDSDPDVLPELNSLD
jgi:hypothetical protein